LIDIITTITAVEAYMSCKALPLKGPKLEIFGSGVFAQIKSVWIGD